LSTVCFSSKAEPKAENGTLDLRAYNFKEDGIVNIKGDWIFFWDEIIDPKNYNDLQGVILPVPSAWTKLDDYIPSIEAKGYASYYLKILLPKNVQSFAFRFTEVFSASGYYINGKNIGFNGLPGTNRFQSIFGYNPTIHVFSIEDTVAHLLVHVSNFEHRSGGIRGSIELGSPMQIMSARADRQIRDFFLIGAFLIIGIYFMGLFLMRSELYKLYFSLICILMVFRLLLLSESEFISGDWITGISRLRLEYLSFSLLVTLFVLMIHQVFQHDFPKIIFNVIMWISFIVVILVIFSPISLFSTVFTYYIIFVVFIAAVVSYVIIIGWIRGRSFAPAYAIGIAVISAGAVNDMLFISDVINTGLISHITTFIYLIIYAMIFSGKNQQEFKHSLHLAEEISSINENLENIVLFRTKELSEKSSELIIHQEELKSSNEVLQREVDLRDRMFTIIGHDIKGPLGYAAQVVELILSGGATKEEEKELMKLLAESSRSTLSLVENLLAWGRSQTGELKTMPVTFQIRKVIDESVGLYELPLRDKEIQLEIDIEEGSYVFADKEQVKLIARNLLANAIKFTKENGKIQISAKSDLSSKTSTITIKDSGIGIPQKELDNLFSDYEITSTVGTKNESGSGLGLKLCKELVELNQGTIHVESDLEKGTVFTVKLPLITFPGE
jgi:signal transduction histidine kinase